MKSSLYDVKKTVLQFTSLLFGSGGDGSMVTQVYSSDLFLAGKVWQATERA